MSLQKTPPVSARLPAGVIALGFVSLFMDLSSEMIHSLLPVFLVTVLGASAMAVGVIEGIAEATAAFAKVFSGAISDWMGRRKPLVLLGYGLAALTKPLFPLATGISAVLVARFLDRVGKGIRGAPRDALIADITPKAQRGAAYGLRQAMDTVGAFAGPLAAMALMAATQDDFRLVFWVAVLPAVVCVLLIVFGVREPEATRPASLPRVPIRREALA
ncbi:MAG: MFS transporter, partial [Burkholderiales bacterium]